MRSARIVMLSPYTDPVRGGISSYTRELAAAYARRGLRCLGLAANGVTNPHFTVLQGNKLAFCARALRELVRKQPGLIHAHSQHWYILLPTVLGKVLCPGARLVVTLHTPAVSEPGGLIDAMVRFLFRFSDRVVFVSQNMRDLFHLPSTVRQSVVLAAPEGDAVGYARHLHSPKKPIIIFVGPLVWSEKVAGVLVLVDAFATVSSTFPEWHLTILGDGPLRPSVEQRVRERGLAGKVDLRGFVDTVYDEIASAKIYAQISLQEGLPLSLLNAMAIGTAVLATSVGGMPEVIRHGQTGYLVEPGAEAVAAGLRQLMTDSDLRMALAKAAKEYVSTGLSWDRVAEQYLALAV